MGIPIQSRKAEHELHSISTFTNRKKKDIVDLPPTTVMTPSPRWELNRGQRPIGHTNRATPAKPEY